MAENINIHKIVYFHRTQAGLSRKELADLADVGKTVIYDLEKGKKTMRWSTINKILLALNINIHFSSPLMTQYEKSNS